MNNKTERASLYRKAITASLRNKDFWRLYILAVLLVFCSIFYYFGEIIDLAGWKNLRLDFFYGVHDVHRLLFIIPIVYAGYVLGTRATILVTLVVGGICTPRALFISPYPDPILRPLIFIMIAGSLGYLAALLRTRLAKRTFTETMMKREIDRLSALSDQMQEGILIISPDYHIRHFNSTMQKYFGEVTSPFCYKYLRGLDEPCRDICKLPEVLAGAIKQWKYILSDDRVFEVLASPYVDADGKVCLYATFRDIKTGESEDDGEPESEEQV